MEHRGGITKETKCMYGILLETLLHFTSVSLCPSTTGCSPPSMPSVVVCLMLSCSRRFPPSLLCRFATFCLVVLLIFSLSCVAILYNACTYVIFHSCYMFSHFNFCFSMSAMKSDMFVLFSDLRTWYLYCSFKCNILLSVTLRTVCHLLIKRTRLAAIGHSWQDTLVCYLFLSDMESCLSWIISLFLQNSYMLL